MEKRFRQLIVPYFWINILSYVAWLAVLRYYGDGHDAGVEWHEPLLGIALGIPPALTHDIPLWSLLSFFVVEAIYYPLHERLVRSDVAIAAIFLVSAAVVSKLSPGTGIGLPMSLAPTLSGMVFYALGHFTRNHDSKFQRLFRPNSLMLILSAAMIAIGVNYNSPVVFYMGHIGNPILFLLGAFGGILFVIQLSVFFSEIWHDPSIIRFISRGTLLVCGFHMLAFAFIKGIMLFGFGVEPAILTEGLWRGLIMSCTGIALCLPVIWLIERYARFLVNK